MFSPSPSSCSSPSLSSSPSSPLLSIGELHPSLLPPPKLSLLSYLLSSHSFCTRCILRIFNVKNDLVLSASNDKLSQWETDRKRKMNISDSNPSKSMDNSHPLCIICLNILYSIETTLFPSLSHHITSPSFPHHFSPTESLPFIIHFPISFAIRECYILRDLHGKFPLGLTAQQAAMPLVPSCKDYVKMIIINRLSERQKESGGDINPLYNYKIKTINHHFAPPPSLLPSIEHSPLEIHIQFSYSPSYLQNLFSLEKKFIYYHTKKLRSNLFDIIDDEENGKGKEKGEGEEEKDNDNEKRWNDDGKNNKNIHPIDTPMTDSSSSPSPLLSDDPNHININTSGHSEDSSLSRSNSNSNSNKRQKSRPKPKPKPKQPLDPFTHSNIAYLSSKVPLGEWKLLYDKTIAIVDKCQHFPSLPLPSSLPPLNSSIAMRISTPPTLSLPSFPLSFLFSFHSYRFPILISGRYNKYLRTLSHTLWTDFNDNRLASSSISEEISSIIKKEFSCSEVKFHSSGREDADVRMITKEEEKERGRPFFIELIDTYNVKEFINYDEKRFRSLIDNLFTPLSSSLSISLVSFSTLSQFNEMKHSVGRKKKSYRCIIHSDVVVTQKMLTETFSSLIHREHSSAIQTPYLHISQSTPLRVIHRRSLLIRSKKIYSLQTQFINSHWFILEVTTSAGLYVKEFVTGDRGRTVPSVSYLLGGPCDILQLDVTGVMVDEKMRMEEGGEEEEEDGD